MALTKTIEIDKIEIVTEYRHVQIRTATIIKEDNVELSRSFHRKTFQCGQLDSSNNLNNELFLEFQKFIENRKFK